MRRRAGLLAIFVLGAATSFVNGYHLASMGLWSWALLSLATAAYSTAFAYKISVED